MKEWLKFSVCYWHTFRYDGRDMFGEGTYSRPRDTGETTLEGCKNRIDAAFEFYNILGVE